MRYLLIFLCLISNAFAAQWVATDTTIVSGSDMNSIQVILDDFPEVSVPLGRSVDDISDLKVSLIHFEFEGENTCIKDDPRLKYEHLSFFMCFKDTSIDCIDYFDQFKPTTDPCL